MKLISKILSSTALIGIATAIVPISMTSCYQQGKQESHKEQKAIPTVKLNTSIAPDDIDINSEYIPFTCENLSESSAGWVVVTVPKALGVTVYYRTPQQASETGWSAWTEVPIDSEEWIEFHAGYKIQFAAYCENNPGKSLSSYGNQVTITTRSKTIGGTQNFRFGGNLSSFLATVNPSSHTERQIECATQLYSEYEFKNLFKESVDLTEVSHNLLPFSEVTKGCYEGMFSGCSILKTAPALPATKHNVVSEYAISSTEEGLAEECYKDMFNNCPTLTVAPDLPAIKLAKNCYTNIFYKCSSLTNISLSYVGNFNNTFFSDWVYGISLTGKIYYNGLDTSKTYKYQIPTNFSIIQNEDLITNYTETLTVVSDPNTSVVTPTTGVKVRAYKDQKFGDIIDTLEKGSSIDGDEVFDHFAYYTNSAVIAETTLVSALTDKVIKPVYEFTADFVEGWVNVFVSQDTTLKFTKSGQSSVGTIYYSTDGGSTYTALTSGKSVNFEAKTQVLLRGICYQSGSTYYGPSRTYSDSSGGGGGQSSSTTYSNLCFTGGSVWIKGNCMDLCRTGSISGTSTRLDYIPNNGCFYELFADSTAIKRIATDVDFLPSTKLTDCCYTYMFSGCSKLKSVSTDLLPTTEFKWTDSSNTTHYGRGSYGAMFYGCEALKTAPNLPAVTMYGNGTLSKSSGGGGGGPGGGGGQSSGTTIGTYTAIYMNCTSLETAPTVAASKIEQDTSSSSTIYADNEFRLMFYNCTSLKTAPKINVSDFSEIEHSGYSQGYAGDCMLMFYGCTSLVSVDLTAITALGTYDLASMFSGCSSLKVNNKGTGSLFFTCPTDISTDSDSPVADMFEGTGGDYQSDPVSGGKYYIG